MKYNKNYRGLTKKQIADELYRLVICYENVAWNTVYRNMFYSSDWGCYKYIGKAHNYSF